jgi:hypothetical protein
LQDATDITSINMAVDLQVKNMNEPRCETYVFIYSRYYVASRTNRLREALSEALPMVNLDIM